MLDRSQLWLLLAIFAYAMLVPSLWILYRWWLRRMDGAAQRFVFHAAGWHFGAGKDLKTSAKLAQKTSGVKVSAKLEAHPQDRYGLRARLGGDLARASAIYVPGLGPMATSAVAAQKSGPQSRFRLPFDAVPPVRPLVDARLWPMGDRLTELTAEQAEKRAQEQDRLSTVMTNLFGNQMMLAVVSRGSRLTFEHYPESLSHQDAVPWPSAGGFVFATLIATLEKKRRLFLGQQVALSEGFHAQRSNVAPDIRSLLNGTSGLGQIDIEQLRAVAELSPLPAKCPDLNGLMRTAIEDSGASSSLPGPNPADLLALSFLLLSGYDNRHGQYLAMPRQLLFDPLSMVNSTVSALENGLLNAWDGLWTTPRDLVRLGLLYQGRGTLGDSALIDPMFCDRLFAGHDPTGGSAPAFHRQCWRNGGLAEPHPREKGLLHRFTELDNDGLLVGATDDALLCILPRSRATVALRTLDGRLDRAAVASFLREVIHDV